MAEPARKLDTGDLPYDVICSSDDRDEWLKARALGIGASEVAAIFGESRWCSAIELYARKIGTETDKDQNEAMFWGLRFERIIAEVYAERTGRHLEWSGLMLRSREFPWLLATLDAITGIANDNGVLRLWPFDSKTGSVFKAAEWAEGPPREYYLQAQQQMLVTGTDRATLGCLIGGQRLVWCDVDRDEVEIRRIIYQSRIFWEQHVLAGVEPAPDGSESAGRALRALHPEAEEDVVHLGAAFQDKFDELAEYKLTQKTLKKQISKLENEFKAELGDAAVGIMPNGAKVTWRERRGGIDYKRAAESTSMTAAEFERFRRKSTRTFGMSGAVDDEES